MRWGAARPRVSVVVLAVLALLAGCGSAPAPIRATRSASPSADRRAFPDFSPTAGDLAAEPLTRLPLEPGQASVPAVAARVRPTGVAADAAETAAYRAALDRLRGADFRELQQDIPGGLSTVTDVQHSGGAFRFLDARDGAGLSVTSIDVGGHAYVPAARSSEALASTHHVDFPDHAWVDNAIAAGTDPTQTVFDQLDPFRSSCDGQCRLTVLPSVGAIDHYFVEVDNNGDGAFDLEGEDVEVAQGSITAFYGFEPGDDGQVTNTDVPQSYTTIAPFPQEQPISGPGTSLILSRSDLDAAETKARAGAAAAAASASAAAAPTRDPACPPATPAGYVCQVVRAYLTPTP